MATDINDPQVTLLRQCGAVMSCGRLMGSLRVYKGAGETDRRHLRGVLVQTCTGCHWTKFPAGPYKFVDAEQLVLRILNSGLVRHNGTLLRPPSPVAAMLPLTQAGRIDCANLPCYTKGGVRTQGSKSCIEFKCKLCCSNAALEATANRIGHPWCNTHSQVAATERQMVQMAGPVLEAPIPSLPMVLDPPHPSTSSSDTDFAIDPQLLALSTSTPLALPPMCPIPMFIPSSSPPVASQRSSPTPISSLSVSRGSGRSLDQPLNPLWADVRNQATSSYH
ncbi:hypothetical protein K443DRAFT_14103 [Laccaria amethystina LaAM-08-1]|uniref:Uncharacterized protein n=1 Tax=Laccaria amethystina LaAM-08-1 TaxID=1095629 RepID=A0A0C9X2C4_9AGAR|nr:hypothetical protein K443DRAFT_14103 [Laccaria amethystina LaAM-08-1]